MNREIRDELIGEYVGRIVGGMDMDTIIAHAHDNLAEALDKLSDEDLRAEIADICPDLLEEV